MTDNWKLQVSPKLPDGTLINLRAETPEEFDQVVGWATANAAKFVDVVTAINAVNKVPALAGNVTRTEVVDGGASNQQNGSGWSQPQTQAAPSFAQPNNQGPACQHGPMVFREGVGAKGPWKAYFCPTKKGDPTQCQPQFQR